MTQQLSSQLEQVRARFGEQVDDLNVPDLKELRLALLAEQERRQGDLARVVRQMHQQRSEGLAALTQLLQCANPDMPLTEPTHFVAVAEIRRRLGHE